MSSLCDKCVRVHAGDSRDNGERVQEQDRPDWRRLYLIICPPGLRVTIYRVLHTIEATPG